MQFEPLRERACAMVSPDSGEIVFTAPGKAAPVAVAPAHAELNDPLRPCERGLVPARAWQPLHSSTSPGRTDSQVRCGVLTRRPLASSSETWNAMLAGTFMRTEPSGSMGA
jgi:hypothetical protein